MGPLEHEPAAPAEDSGVTDALHRLRGRRARAALIAKQNADAAAEREMMLMRECLAAAKSSARAFRRLVVEWSVLAVFLAEFGMLFLVPAVGLSWLYVALAAGIVTIAAIAAVFGFSKVPDVLFAKRIYERQKRAFLKKARQLGALDVLKGHYVDLRRGLIRRRREQSA